MVMDAKEIVERSLILRGWVQPLRILPPIFKSPQHPRCLGLVRTDIVHSHLLFHLPAEYRFGRKLDELTVAIERLVARHGGGIWSEHAVKLKVWLDPDGLYLLKGGGPEVWRLFRIKKKWREAQGVIQGKRCGVTQKISAKQLAFRRFC